jgi:hypothetical protein
MERKPKQQHQFIPWIITFPTLKIVMDNTRDMLNTIRIEEFKNYRSSEVREHLLGFSSYDFIITCPRYFFSGREDAATAVEFCTMAYIGQLLHDVSVSFGYYVPWPPHDNEFYFQIEVKDFDRLANVLARVTASLFTSPRSQELFEREALQYSSDCFNAKRESDCWGLLDVSNKHRQ